MVDWDVERDQLERERERGKNHPLVHHYSFYWLAFGADQNRP